MAPGPRPRDRTPDKKAKIPEPGPGPAEQAPVRTPPCNRRRFQPSSNSQQQDEIRSWHGHYIPISDKNIRSLHLKSRFS